MLHDMALDMPAIEELLHLSNLPLRIELNQVHKLQMVGFLWYESEKKEIRASKKTKQHSGFLYVQHSPYLDVAVHKDSTAAQADSPLPMTRMTSTRIVSTFNAAETRP